MEDNKRLEDQKEDTDKAPVGTASVADIVKGNVLAQAKQKLEEELEKAKDKAFADPVIKYLLERCEEDCGLGEDVLQEHKTWEKCFDYIYEQARKQAEGNRAAVRDDVVYEWAEDYYHKDDKAEEAEKAKKESEAKAKREKALAEKKATAKNKPAKTAAKPSTDKNKAKAPIKKEKPKEHSKSKKSCKDMEGQLDMFSMMGM